ncbi:ABC transporter permease subunit [Escherichia coli]
MAVMLPMWASYIVKSLCPDVIAGKRWRGSVVFTTSWAGTTADCVPYITCGGRQYAVNFRAGALSGVSHIWLPFMILPVQAALERLPPSLLQASADLGARPRQTFRYVVLPLAIPALPLALSLPSHSHWAIFIVPQLVGPPGYFIGNMVYSQQGRLAICRWRRHSPTVPIVLIALYRRS